MKKNTIVNNFFYRLNDKLKSEVEHLAFICANKTLSDSFLRYDHIESKHTGT